MIQQEEFDFSVGKPTIPPVITPEKTEFDFSVGEQPEQKQVSWGDILKPKIAHTTRWGDISTPKIAGKAPIDYVGEFMKPVAEEAIGIGEGAVAGVSGLAAFIPSLVAGLASKASGKSFEEAEAFQQEIASLLTHEPVTEKGKAYGEVANAPFAAISTIIEKAAEVGGDDPETQSMLRMAGGVGLLVAGGYLHGSAKTFVENTVKKGKSIARAKTLIAKSKDVPPELKKIVEKLPDLPPESKKWSPDRKPTPQEIAEQAKLRQQAMEMTAEETAGKGGVGTRQVEPTPAKVDWQKRLVVALRGTDGKIYKGKPGETHIDLVNRYKPKLQREVGDVWATETGFLDLENPSKGIISAEKAHQLTKIQPRTLTDLEGKPLFPDRIEAKDLAGRPETTHAKVGEGIKEVHAGYNIKEELKKSIQFLKGEDPYKIGKKELTKKDASLEPPTSPTLKKILDEKPVEPPMPEAGQVIYDALVESKPLRGEQAQMVAAERGKKMGIGLEAAKELRGKARAEAFRKAQKGKGKKLQFEPPKVPIKAEETMYDVVWESPLISEWERLSANEGLGKLMEGRIPYDYEIGLLDRVFPKSLVDVMMKKRTTWMKIKHGVLEGSGIPRALMASWDFSAPFRQGAFLAARYPKQFFKSFGKMFEMFGSEKAYQAVHESIKARETYPLMRKAELAITEMDSILRLREEQFMSHWAEKIHLVRRSGRAHTGFLNLLRANVFDSLVKSAEKMGHNPQQNTFLIKSLGNFINVASGRGSLKSVLGLNLEKSAVILNQALFSPRLMSSRLKLLNPAFYIKAHPFVRRQALQSLLAFVGAGTTVLTILKAAGADVEIDPRSSRFGKATIGNTSIDPWGGFIQYIRTGAQGALGQTKSAKTGDITEVKGVRLLPYPKLQKGEEGPYAPTTLSLGSRWLEYKQAPLLSFATDLLRGSTAFGPLDFSKGLDDPLELSENPIAQRFIPLVMQDMMDIYRDNPDLLPVSVLGLFGVGLQTYEPRKKKGGGFGY